MDAGIGPSRPVNRNRRPEDSRQALFDTGLDRSGIGLALKAMEIRTVIGNDETNILLGHYSHRMAARMAVTISTAAMAMASR